MVPASVVLSAQSAHSPCCPAIPIDAHQHSPRQSQARSPSPLHPTPAAVSTNLSQLSDATNFPTPSDATVNSSSNPSVSSLDEPASPGDDPG